MPRPNRLRTLGSEKALAERIALLCEQRGMKYPELAERMTKAGCAIQTSALYKLHAQPPRSIKVDELVAIANVFDLSTDDLLRPISIVEQEWAEDVARDYVEATKNLDDAYAQLLRAAVRLAEIARKSSDLYDFVSYKWQAAEPGRQWFGEFSDEVSPEQLRELAARASLFWTQMLIIVRALSKAD